MPMTPPAPEGAAWLIGATLPELLPIPSSEHAVGGQVDLRRSGKRTSIRPLSAAMVGSAPSIRLSSRMVSIFSRLFEQVTEPPVRLPAGLPVRLIEPWNWLIRLKVRLLGMPL
jgi:hypothetical protein